MRRTLKALAAAITLLALVVGVPALLAATIGNPLPGWTDLLAGDVSDTAIIDVLVTVAYLAWAQFALAVVAEVLAAVTRIRIPGRLPGVFPGQRQVAHSLVAAVFVLSPVAGPLTAGHAVSPSPFTTTVATAPSAHTITAAAPTASAGSSEKTGMTSYVVQADGPGTYWDLADTFLGRGERWQEIWDLNRGRHQPDGAVMSSPGLLRPGWSVVLPTSATAAPSPARSNTTTHVTVQAGDTLSGIAAANDVADWHRLWHDNAGKPEPHGRALVDPNHIEPGWMIDVAHPDRTTPHLELTTPPPAEPLMTTPPKTPSRSSPTAESPAPRGKLSPLTPKPTPDALPTPPPATASSGAPNPVLASIEPTAPSTRASLDERDSVGSTRGAAAQQDPALEPDADHRTTLVEEAFGVGGQLLAGTAALALLSYRRSQGRHRRPGRAVRTPPKSALSTARALAVASTSDVVWLDHALRGLTHQLTGTDGARLPDVTAARLTADHLELMLSEPLGRAPGAWTVGETATRWRLARDAATGYDPDRRDFLDAPYPLLVSIGHTATGEYWLLDLERAGVVSLTGNPAHCLDLARFIAAELAVVTTRNSLWVTAAGFAPDDLPEHGCARLVVSPDAEAAVTAAQVRLDFAARALDRTGIDILASRLHAGPEGWYPETLLLPHALAVPGAAELAKALASADRRTSVAVVQVTTDSPSTVTKVHSGLQLDIDGAGVLRVPELGLELAPQSLTAQGLRDLAGIFAAALALDDEPIPGASGDAAWTAYADASGSLNAHFREPMLTDPPELSEESREPTPVEEPVAQLLAAPLESYLQAAATTASDVVALAPSVAPSVRRQIQDADPTLDDDLAAWHDPDSPVAKLAVLGPVTVHATGPLPSGSPRIPWNTEVVAYLAAHAKGVTAEQLAADLWPGPLDAVSSKLRQSVVVVRKWLATNPATGEPHLPRAINPRGGPGLYRIEGLLVDADLFRRLRLRGQASGPDGVNDLRAALDLVAGPPYDQRRHGGYSWLADTPLDHEYTAMIVDVAHTVAIHDLAATNPAAAAAAANVALLAGSLDDIPLLDRLAAADSQAHSAEAEHLRRQIMTNHDAEIEEDLPPRTYEILRRRNWLANLD